MSSLPTVSVREWTDVVRRARLGKTTKYVALTLATYADYSNGRRVYPGIARLSTACELAYNTVKAALRTLREDGLIELVSPANSHGQADEYRLILAEDLLERVEVMTPAAFDVEVEKLRKAKRGVYVPKTNGPDDPDLRPVGSTADDGVCGPPDVPQTTKPAARPTTREEASAARLTNDLRPVPRPPTTHTPNTLTTSHSDEDVRTAVTHTRARAPQDPDSSLPERCAHGLASRLRADGTPSCAICRREDAKPSATVFQLRPRHAPEAS